MGGLEALPQILSTSPGTKVVLFSGLGLTGDLVPAGVSGYLHKGLTAADLLHELDLVTAAA
jgi:DNA-binding NarL/FixJ family response regulator